MVVNVLQPLGERAGIERRGVQRVERYLGAANRLHKRRFKARRDRHDLARRLHLRAESAGGADKLIKRPLGELDDNIVKSRLKAGAGLAGDVVLYLVKGIAESDFRGDLRDGIAGRLGREGGGAGDAGVDLDDRVLKAVGVQRELAVAAADDVERGDDVQRGGAEHLVLLIRERERGGDDNAVAGVHADGVEVLHGADGDDVAGGVAHCLKLDLLPAVDVLFDKDLGDGGGGEPAQGGRAHLLLVIRDAAAGAAERKGGADNDGVADT